VISICVLPTWTIWVFLRPCAGYSNELQERLPLQVSVEISVKTEKSLRS
jgi:hypothetical protein